MVGWGRLSNQGHGLSRECLRLYRLRKKFLGGGKVGTGVNPYINPAKSSGLQALEVRFSFHFPQAVPYSAALAAQARIRLAFR
jgi:hypothetical protein